MLYYDSSALDTMTFRFNFHGKKEAIKSEDMKNRVFQLVFWCTKSQNFSFGNTLILWDYSKNFQNDQKIENQCIFRGGECDIFLYYNGYLVKSKLKTFGAKKLLMKSCWITLKLSGI